MVEGPQAAGRRLRKLAGHVAARVLPPQAQQAAATATPPEADIAAVVTAARRSHFQQHGWVVLPSVFGAAQMGRLEDELHRHMAEEMPAATGGWDGKTYLTEVPGDLSTTWRISPLATPYFDALASGVLQRLWEEVFGVKAVPYSGSGGQFFDKCPLGCKTTPPHQDGAYLEILWLSRRCGAAEVRVGPGGFSIGRIRREPGWEGCAEEGNVVVAIDGTPRGFSLRLLQKSEGLRRHGPREWRSAVCAGVAPRAASSQHRGRRLLPGAGRLVRGGRRGRSPGDLPTRRR